MDLPHTRQSWPSWTDTATRKDEREISFAAHVPESGENTLLLTLNSIYYCYVCQKSNLLCEPFHFQEPVLRATRYLPDIVKLQHSLFNLFHRRAGKENAKDQTIGSFFKGIKSGKSCVFVLLQTVQN